MTMTNSRRVRLLSGAAAALLGGFAGTAAAAQAEGGSIDVSEVVVTATKQAVRLDKVPLSVSAYTPEAIEKRGIRDIRDVALQTPGVDIPNDGGGRSVQRVSIRGIESTAGAATAAVYIDDTPIQARNASINYSGSTIPYIFDLERIEVLRGPQGTLFGASSQGGAIRFITPTPSVTRYTAMARARASVVEDGDASYELGVAAGGPIVEDRLGFRASFLYRDEGGWIDRQDWQDPTERHSNVNSTESTVFRAALNFKPVDWMSIQPSLFYQNVKQNDRSPLYSACPDSLPLAPGFDPCPRGVADPDDGKFLSYSTIAQPGSDKFYLPSLKMVADKGPVTFTSVTSYLYRHVIQLNDATYNNDRVSLGNNWLFPVIPGRELQTYQNPDTEQRLFTQELRLASADPSARVRWTAGVYYSRSSLKSDLPITSAHYPDAYAIRFGRPLAATPFMVDGIHRYYGNENTIEKTLAAFGNVDVTLLEGLTLSVGARYSRDTIDFDIVERGVSYAGGISTAAGTLKEKPFTPRVALSWQQSEDTLVYGSYARGYRAGGVNKAVPDICEADLATLGIDGGNTYDSDKTDTYELGVKSALFERRVTFQASVFRTKWKDIQQQIRLPCAFSLVANTASAVSQGGDLSVSFRATDNLTLTAAVGYTDAEYEKTIIVGTSPLVFEGQSLGATPWTVNLAADYSFMAFGRDAFARAQYTSKSAEDGPYPYQNPMSSLYDPTRGGGYGTSQLDLRVGVDVTPLVTVEAYVENALNEVSYLSNAPTYIRGPLWLATAAKPRVIGIQATARY
ncbi:TonB-dependent receptor [Phenylobacterium zucineum HLK1]|uniref:TonB-dependent receptor n=1 Tax=Phenylobacterium zucineum (strain HLK1) TaxID=450851 RepID=B4RDM3_PHEZH|nr:TonB-dependent receptor [Phenylobacterium zucineum]ACG78413.1 TonB-dependent receptor [Phenylobacterium zucineum HLK1]